LADVPSGLSITPPDENKKGKKITGPTIFLENFLQTFKNERPKLFMMRKFHVFYTYDKGTP
jgi:hypothetical protein